MSIDKIDMEASIGAVMVKDENSLSELKNYPYGTIAFTAGYKNRYETGCRN